MVQNGIIAHIAPGPAEVVAEAPAGRIYLEQAMPVAVDLAADDQGAVRIAVGLHERAVAGDDLAHHVADGLGDPEHGTRGEQVAADRRLNGYLAAIRDAGLEVDDRLIVQGRFTYRSGMQASERLISVDPRPTAIFAASDEMAVGAILAARELGVRVPEDLSVVGVDGHELGASLGLTSVDQFPREQGVRAAETVLDLLEPEAVRRIRKRLHLTQKDAGRLIGGGPNAFQKYESGDVVVSHAVMSALLLLDRDPSGLSVLKQRVHRKEAA